MEDNAYDDDERVPSVSYADLVAWNFRKDGEDSFLCLNCQTPNVKKAGANGNLIKHCASKTCFGFTYRNVSDKRHNRDLQPIFRPYHQAKRAESLHGVRKFVNTISPKARQIFAWIELIVDCDLPISVCENRTFRKHARPPGMSRKTLRKNFIKLSDIVGLIIRDCIGPGACSADGWTCAGIHYLGIYHSWPSMASNSEIVIKNALLSLGPMVDEKTYTAESQAKTIEATYELYGPFDDLVICLTLDNTNVNPATSRILRKPMIGAYCHRLNLAVQAWLKEAFHGELMDELETIHAVMLRASTLKQRGALKEYTPYVPELKNKTRWTGYHNMAAKYEKLHDPLDKTGNYRHISDEDAEEIEDDQDDTKTKRVKPILMKPAQFSTFKRQRLPCLKTLKGWFQVIQSPLNLALARDAFERARNHHLLKGHCEEFEERLRPTHSLVVSPSFEAGVEKIINEDSEDLTEDEKEACKALLKKNWRHLYPKRKDDDDLSDDVEEDPSSPSKFLKKLNQSRKPMGSSALQSRYITNLNWIDPTTVKVERLFSRCRNVLTYKRRRLLPRIFEAIVFLRENRSFWSIETVQEMVSGRWDDRLGGHYDSDDDSDEDECDIQ